LTNELSNSRRFRRKHAWIIGLLLVGGVASYEVAGWTVRSSAVEMLREAGKDLKRNESKSARERLRWLLWFEPEHTEALLIMGISFHVDRDFAQAIRVLERINSESEEFEGASLVLARSYLLVEQVERSEIALNACLKRFPASDEAREELIQLYMIQLRRRETISLLYDRWNYFPDDLLVLKSLLLASVEPLTPEGPSIYFEQVNSRHPGQAAVVLTMARTAALLGEEERADRFFNQALELRPNHFLTKLLSAEFFLSRGDDRRARQLVDLMSKMTFDDCDARSDDRYWAIVAKIRENEGELEESFAAIQKALEIRPNDYSLLSSKCGLLRKMERGDEARKLAARASQISDAERELFLLADEANLEMITREQCGEFARLLETLGYHDQASGWRVVMELVD
jgi:tetratricopeptide (TPR) repeat protein